METAIKEIPDSLETLYRSVNHDFKNQNKIGIQKTISGIEKEIISIFNWISICKLVFRHFKNPVEALKIISIIDNNTKKFLGDGGIKKYKKVDGKYYLDLYIPGLNSIAYEKFMEGEINRISTIDCKTNRFTNIFIAITKKCPLRCEHCFEWDALNKNETLSLSDIQEIVNKIQEKGSGIIQFTGGEPMLRMDDLIEILNQSKKDTAFWVLTSGYKFTFENAKRLKDAGLTGVVVSLDHFNPEMHNLFRGSKKSFQWVEAAVENAIANNLVTALSICVSNSFITQNNLMKYIELAKEMGVSFVQILEPKAVGHYAGKDIILNKKSRDLLDDFYYSINFDKKYMNYPIVTYHGHYQRQIGCFAAGNRNLYIDTDGDIHACPFCREKMGSALANNLDELLLRLQIKGCQTYKNSSF